MTRPPFMPAAATLAAALTLLAATAGQAPLPESPAQPGDPAPADAAGEPAPVLNPAVEISDDVLAQLDNDDWRLREAATTRLLHDDAVSAASVVLAFPRAASAEQRYRLLLVARHHLVRYWAQRLTQSEHEGSLGVRMETVPATGQQPAAVRIASTLAGFPAHGRLLPGDLVLAVDGRPLTAADPTPEEQFRQGVVTHGPGQPVRLKIRREEREMDVTLRTASMSALVLIYDSNTASLRTPFAQGWDLFRRRLLAGQTPTLDPPLPAARNNPAQDDAPAQTIAPADE